MSDKIRSAAVVLSAGSGKRMGGNIKKQYMLLDDKPVIFYALYSFEKSNIDEIVLVVGAGDEENVRKDIVEKFGFKKIKKIVAGGKERYHSVYNGIKAVSADTDVVLIHDGARPFTDPSLINKCIEAGLKDEACVVAVKAKDTIRICDESGMAVSTPDRSSVWQMQTPQVLSYKRAVSAFQKLMENEDELLRKGINITDDVMVAEYFEKIPVKMIEGSYENIKITTPEDLLFAGGILKKKRH